jgi:hypothetical protein
MIGIIRRIGLVAAAGLLLPACGGNFKAGSTLFTEQFNGAFPGTSWTAPVTTGAPSVAIDGTTGLSAPSLKMTTTTATASATTRTVLGFNNPNVSISVHMAAQSGGTSEIGTGTVSIVDSTPAVVATASWDNATNLITFHINGGSADQTVAVAANSSFHRLLFTVSASGVASWTFDNGAPLVTRSGFPPGLLQVDLGSTFGAGSAWPSFFFDFVNVTSP